MVDVPCGTSVTWRMVSVSFKKIMHVGNVASHKLRTAVPCLTPEFEEARNFLR